MATKGPHKTLPTARRVRILYNGKYIADSTSSLLVWEHPYYPQHYLPTTAFDQDAIKVGAEVKSDDGTVIAKQWALQVGSRSAENQAIAFVPDLSGPGEAVRDHVKVVFGAADSWLEEDTPIYVHPKDPFKRVDVLHSTRPITVSVGGKVVAKTTTSMHLHETGLPVRYYLPLTAVDQTVLRPSELRTQCPYKGEAQYYSVEIGEKTWSDVVWYYVRPTIECAAIQGLVCFYNEKVDIEIDGVKEERQTTPWS